MSTRRRSTRGVATVIASIGLGLSACGGSASPTASPTENQTVADSTAPQSGVPEILSFTAPLVGGGEIDARTLAGKPAVLWFWAPT